MPYGERKAPKPSDPRSLEAYALAYIEHVRALHQAEQGVRYKHAALRRFIAWCHERGIERVEQITRPVLQRYQRHLYYALENGGQPLSIGAQRNRLTAVRTWFRFLMRENLILYNPASELELPKRERRLPKHALTAEEAEHVLSQPDLDSGRGLRDRAIMEVLYSTGIRRMELLNLRLQDLNRSAGVLAVRQGKGKKDRFLPIGERALAWVQKYLDEVRPHYQLPNSPDNLFLGDKGGKLNKHHLGQAIKTYVKQSGVEKTGACHLFRHTMATLMLENGADIRFIQQMLGHSQLSTTEIYTHVAIHKLKEVHTLTHPAKLKRGQRSAERKEQEADEEPTLDTLFETLEREQIEDDD